METIKKEYQKMESIKDVYSVATWFGDIISGLILEDKLPCLVKIEIVKDSLRDKK